MQAVMYFWLHPSETVGSVGVISHTFNQSVQKLILLCMHVTNCSYWPDYTLLKLNIKQKLEFSPGDRCSHLSWAIAVCLCPRQQAPFLGHTSSAPPGEVPPTYQPEALSTQHQKLYTPCAVCGLLSQPWT